MKFPSLKLANLSNLIIRLALLRAMLRLGGFALRRAMAPVMRATTATARDARTPASRRVIDGEFRRVDPRHNNNW